MINFISILLKHYLSLAISNVYWNTISRKKKKDEIYFSSREQRKQKKKRKQKNKKIIYQGEEGRRDFRIKLLAQIHR